MSPQLSQFLETAYLDAAKALPAALARVMLGWPVETKTHLFTSITKRAMILLGSVSLAVFAGDIARQFAATREMAPLIVAAVAFNAQHAMIRASRRSKEFINALDQHSPHGHPRNKKRNHG